MTWPLACPQSHQALVVAADHTVERLNLLIGQRALRDASGGLVTAALGGGLVCADGSRLYPVRDGVPVLRPEAAILLLPEDLPENG